MRWDEHNNPMKKSNSSNHIKDNLDLVFTWSLLANAPKNMFQQKVLVTYYVVLEKPNLNEQLEPNRLNQFRNNIT